MYVSAVFKTALLVAIGAVVLDSLLRYGAGGSSDLDTIHYEAMQNVFNKYTTATVGSSSSKTNTPPALTQLLSVMSFNVRLDAEESNPNHHFTRRVFRLRDTLLKWEPALVGMQEPFGPQVHHLLSTLPLLDPNRTTPNHNDAAGKVYAPAGQLVKGVDSLNLLHPARHDAFQCGILYRPDVLELLDQEYFWLSKTPTVPRSKDWHSMGIRTVNIALFRLLSDTNKRVIMVNTHLDVRSEAARRGQSKVLRELVDEYLMKLDTGSEKVYVFLSGDFNSAPGQSAHRTFLKPNKDVDITKHHILNFDDMWESCVASAGGAQECVVDTSTRCTFHGWLGSIVNSVVSRLLHSLLFTLHSMEFQLPLRVPSNGRELLRDIKTVFTKAPNFPNVFEAMPSSFFTLQRYHVDWILGAAVANPHSKGTVATGTKIKKVVPVLSPRFMAVVDVRDANFSSDHFPVIGVFELA